MFSGVNTMIKCIDESDDYPPVIISGIGMFYESRVSSNLAMDELIHRIKERNNRIICLDEHPSNPTFLKIIQETSYFNTSGLSEYRQVCIVRDLDTCDSERVSAVSKAVFRSNGTKWWLFSVSSLNKLSQSFVGGCYILRATTKENISDLIKCPKIKNREDISIIIKSGAPFELLLQSFYNYAITKMPIQEAICVTQELDLAVKNNTRNMLTTVITENAYDQIPGNDIAGSMSSMSLSSEDQ
ncbi:hypothetical protein TetV_271 [Tetraselmis virus 1]|uniref:Uncharacterized protein n=1 Tax=Tetraselmis virus 1 TaxID=2060617 RepID=A0A2P0VN92_9VIRU|nr:hypothetical protein QJ968_gp271 [Tetraselmis virus 1]AUF82363.1 hypothetical protein TetV_271 [Tetraselmis virus 1]